MIAAVRVGTRNAVMREFAQRANDFVLTHLTLLESTGLVDYATLPPPPNPTAAPAGAATSSALRPDSRASSFVGSTPGYAVGLLAAAAAVGVVGGMRVLRRRARVRRRAALLAHRPSPRASSHAPDRPDRRPAAPRVSP